MAVTLAAAGLLGAAVYHAGRLAERGAAAERQIEARDKAEATSDALVLEFQEIDRSVDPGGVVERLRDPDAVFLRARPGDLSGSGGAGHDAARAHGGGD